MVQMLFAAIGNGIGMICVFVGCIFSGDWKGSTSGSSVCGSVASAIGQKGVRQGCMKRVIRNGIVAWCPDSVVRNIDLLH